MDLERARLRLTLSDAELQCPMKGVIAIARCLQLQRETEAAGAACTCPVFRAYAGPMPELEPDAPADEDAAHRKRLELLHAAGERRKRAAAPPPAQETEMKKEADTDAMLAAIEGEPAREWTLAELHALRGGPGSSQACGQVLMRLANDGTLQRVRRGYYRWAGASAAAAPEGEGARGAGRGARGAGRGARGAGRGARGAGRGGRRHLAALFARADGGARCAARRPQAALGDPRRARRLPVLQRAEGDRGERRRGAGPRVMT